MNTKQLTALYEKLELKSRRGRGGDYPYVPWQDVADRMNKVFEGNWSSEVQSETAVGDGVVVRVRVTVKDIETNTTHYQEGYGGAAITGAEIGTIYKSAYSKALRDACKKWGPGLYTDDYEDTTTTSKKSVNPPSIVTQTKTSIKSSVPKTGVKIPTIKTVSSSIPTSIQKSDVTTASISVPPQTKPVQRVVTSPNSVVSKSAIIPPTNVPKNVIPVAGNTKTNVTTVIPSQDLNLADNKINDVQMAALDGLLELNNADVSVMIKGAFEDGKLDTTVIPIKEELTYQQAVLVIKYGNNKFRM